MSWRWAPARQEFRTLASDIDKTLDALAQALGGNASALQNLLDLREDHHRLGPRLVQMGRGRRRLQLDNPSFQADDSGVRSIIGAQF